MAWDETDSRIEPIIKTLLGRKTLVKTVQYNYDNMVQQLYSQHDLLRFICIYQQ